MYIGQNKSQLQKIALTASIFLDKFHDDGNEYLNMNGYMCAYVWLC